MADAAAQQIQQVQIVPAMEIPAEDRMAAAMGLDEGPQRGRTPDGRFIPKETPEAPASAEVPLEIPPEQQQEGDTAPVESAPSADDPPTIEIDPDLQFVDVEEVLPGGGKEVKKYSLNELKAQRMMNADYTRKTQEIAAQRREIQEHADKSIAHERNTYLQTLATLQKAVIQSAAPELQNVNWNSLAAENPAEYVRLSNRAREVQQAVAAIQQEQQNLQTRQHAEQQTKLSQAIAKSREAIQQAIPDWSDSKYQSVMKRAVESYGFTPQEIAAEHDHRLIRALHDADQYRQMMAQKPITEKKLVAVPKVVKPGTQQRVGDKRQDNLRQSRERLRQSGSVDDLADVFGQLLK